MPRPFLRIRAALLHWLSLALVVLPSGVKIPIYRWVYGYKIGKHVRIGLSWIEVGKLEIGDHVVIRHFNRFKNIPEVRIGDYSTIGNFNTFTSTFEFTNEKGMAARGNRPMLILGRHCGIALLHYFDVQDTIAVGSYTTIAGMGSVFFTHYLDVISGTQSTKPISVGEYCMVGSSARFTPGASLANCCVVGMAGVVTKQFTETHLLVGGNPAIAIRALPEDAAYFKRSVGWIGSFTSPPFGAGE